MQVVYEEKLLGTGGGRRLRTTYVWRNDCKSGLFRLYFAVCHWPISITGATHGS